MRTPPTVATTPSLETVVFDADLLVEPDGFGLDAGFGAVLLAGACAPALSVQAIITATAIHDAPAVLFTACTSLVFAFAGP
jgi:hypothetical protein